MHACVHIDIAGANLWAHTAQKASDKQPSDVILMSVGALAAAQMALLPGESTQRSIRLTIMFPSARTSDRG